MKICFKTMQSILLMMVFVLSISNLNASSPRKAMLEEGTNASCGPCAYANPILEAYLAVHLDEIVPLVYHAWWPGPNDPMYTNDVEMNKGRIQYYKISGVPDSYFNGKSIYPGDTAKIDSCLKTIVGTTSPLTITIKETRENNIVTIEVTVQSDEEISNKKLRIAATEYFHFYPSAGSNGEKEFYYLARKMFPDFNGADLNLAAGASQKFTYNYAMKDSWYQSAMYLVAFVQDDATKEVLQAASNFDPSKIKILNAEVQELQNKYLKVDKNSNISTTVTVKNPNAEAADFKVSIDSAQSTMPAGWTIEFEPPTFNLAAGATKEVNVKLNTNDVASFAKITIQGIPNTENINLPDTKYFFTLTGNAKYAIYSGMGNRINIETFLSLDEFKNDAVTIPLSEEIVDAYPPQNFDFVMYNFNSTYSNVMGGTSTYANLANKLFYSINQMLISRKMVLITCETGLSSAYGTGGSQSAINFYNNTLGLYFQYEPISRLKKTGTTITDTIEFNCTGFADDPISNGFEYLLNQTSSTHKTIVTSTDLLKPIEGYNAVPFLYYDNKEQNIGGIRIESENQGRLAYMSFGFEAIIDDAIRKDFMKKIINWLANGASSVNENIIDNDIITLKTGSNPISSESNISFSLNGDSPQLVKVSLMNQLGNEVFILNNDVIAPGSYSKLLSTSTIPSGLYFLVARVGNKSQQLPIIIAK